MKKLKIKFKVKYVFIIILSVFVVIPNLIIGVASILYNLDKSSNMPKSYYMKDALNLYVKMPKISPFEDLAYYIMAKNSYTYNETNYVGLSNIGSYIHEGNNNYIGGKAVDEAINELRNEGIDKAIKYHSEAISKKDDGKYYWKNVFSLVNLYYINGEIQKSFDKLNEIKKSDNELMVNIVFLNEGILNLKIKEYDKAIKSFESINDTEYALKNKYLGDAYMLKGDYKKANEYYQKPINEVNNQKVIKKINEYRIQEDIDYLEVEKPSPDVWYNDENTNNKIQDDFKNNLISDKFRGSVKGNLNLRGINMEGTIVALLSNSGIRSGGPMVFSDIETFSYVGKDGSFEFNNIPEGKYHIALMIPKQKYLEANIKIELFNADDFFVERGKTIELNIDEDFFNSREYSEEKALKYNSYTEENKIILKEEKYGEIEMFKHDFDSLNLNIGDEIRLYKLFLGDPLNLFKYEYYKRSDKESYKTDDSGYFNDYSCLDIAFRNTENLIVVYPKVVMEYMEFNEYEKVLKYYENEYKKDNKNEFTLQMLIKLYTTGTNEIGDNKDVNKAISFADKLYEINKDKNLDRQIREFILDKYQIYYQYN